MRKGRLAIAALLGLILTAALVLGQAAEPALKTFKISFQEYKLKNGLRVILSEDHAAPTYSIAVTYNVGSRDEHKGRTGFAHLFEHMMFQGSENVGKGEHFILILNNGGDMNGTTNSDRTNYFQKLPANQLDLGLFLEADRMKSLVINKANLDNQRNAVQEERRLGEDNQPYGRTNEILLETAYDNFAYKHDTIGSMEDLNAATVDDVKDFFRVYYAPNNAVLALVGDFKPEEAKAKIEKYFGSIPSQPAPPAPDMAEPPQTAERQATLQDPFAPMVRVDVGYKIPPANTLDFFAIDMLGDILATGASSRLYQSLVKDKEVAIQVGEFSDGRRATGIADFVLMVRPGKSAKEAQQALFDEIARVQKEGVAEWELQKIKLIDRRQRAQSLESTLSRAVALGEDATFYNDPNLVNTSQEIQDKVTLADLQRVAKTYLTANNRTIITTVPRRGQRPGPPGEEKH